MSLILYLTSVFLNNYDSVWNILLHEDFQEIILSKSEKFEKCVSKEMEKYFKESKAENSMCFWKCSACSCGCISYKIYKNSKIPMVPLSSILYNQTLMLK